MAQKPYEIITNRIVTLLEQGTVPWQQPWATAAGLPRNLFTQRPYNGINVWLLGSMGYQSPFWTTFTQVKAAGGSVRKGEHGTPVVFWKVYTREDAGTGESEKRFALKQFTVFNAAQVDGVALPQLPKVTTVFCPITQCETLVEAMPQRPTITHGEAQAYYRSSTDSVHMPAPETFTSPEHYYSTLFHELTHSTGHPARLDRATLKDAVRFGEVSYAKEELVAEMGAAFLAGICGIENATVDQSAAYIKGWLKALRDDVKMVVQAAMQAQKAAEFIQGVRQECTEKVQD